MAVLRVREAFVAPNGGYDQVFRPGDLLDDADPIVSGREHLFETVEVAASRASRVEAASAAPGEKRSVEPAPVPAPPKTKG